MCKFHRIFCLLVLLLIPGQMTAQSLRCFILTPPDQLLEGIEQIAVADFNVTSRYSAEKKTGGKDLDKILSTIEMVANASGAVKKDQPFADSGTKLADLIIGAMIEEDRGVSRVNAGFLGLGSKEGRTFQKGAKTNVFTVVERSRLDEVMEELKLGQTGLINEAQAAEVGKMLGVDAIVTGSVNVSVQDKWVKETRTKNKKKYTVNCNKRTANVSSAMRIINVETGELIGSKEAKKKKELKKCEGDWGGDLPPAENTVDECLKEVVARLADYFVPRFEEKKFSFKKIKAKPYKNMAEIAKDAIDQYDLRTAYLQYAAIVQDDPYYHDALYNLGTLHEVVGNYEKAIEQYTMASKLKSNEKDYREAKARVQKQINFWNKLNALDVFLEPHNFEATTEELQAATVSKIRTNGSGEDRWEVKANADAASQTLVRVPGDIELEIIDESQQWYKVRLLDGSEGFLWKEYAKRIQ